ncbi:hypothetical protein pipiens_007630 [Culex pipiens pipiens]|uniref:procollagen-proline 4-dioxygenase n=1 Tax=Culex pipiens pipiens TaxID=38569 RepID=A0ABD1DKE9_CULPP
MAAPKFLLSTLGSVLFFLLAVEAQIPSEFYSSIQNMELLLKSELAILDRLDKIIRLSEARVSELKRQRDSLRRDLEGVDSLEYVSNPVSAFLMTKRLLKDYQDIDALIRKELDVKLIDDTTIIPATVDLLGVAEGLSRLQDLYLLEVEDMADGYMYGYRLNRKLNAKECFEIALAMSQSTVFENANKWFREALRRWEAEESPKVSKVEILDYFTFSLFEDAEYQEAYDRTIDLLRLDPKNEGALQKKETFAMWLKFVEENGPMPKEPKLSHALYEPLCRGEVHRFADELSKLRCRLDTTTTPFLRLAPLKVEEVSLEPPIYLYHKVISDEEIDKLIELGKARLNRATVGQMVSQVRISQNVWLSEEVDPLLGVLQRRTYDMSRGLSMQGFDMVQVNNYGIGGHNIPHYDCDSEYPPFPQFNMGNRLATLMYYLSDVEVGGGTVFPRLSLGVFPIKGSAIFWHNVHHNGNVDERMLHAGCPTLIGSKWVANIWIHEYHQEFVLPCKLYAENLPEDIGREEESN